MLTSILCAWTSEMFVLWCLLGESIVGNISRAPAYLTFLPIKSRDDPGPQNAWIINKGEVSPGPLHAYRISWLCGIGVAWDPGMRDPNYFWSICLDIWHHIPPSYSLHVSFLAHLVLSQYCSVSLLAVSVSSEIILILSLSFISHSHPVSLSFCLSVILSQNHIVSVSFSLCLILFNTILSQYCSVSFSCYHILILPQVILSHSNPVSF
jgi:hypothetical protein